MTLCVELGMHRKPTANSPSREPRDLELRRRIFWSCYCLDRLTSMLLGRTFAISYHDINVEVIQTQTLRLQKGLGGFRAAHVTKLPKSSFTNVSTTKSFWKD